MCDNSKEGMWKLMEDEMEWVFDLSPDQWQDAPEHLLNVKQMIPSQVVVTVSGMCSIEEMYRINYAPEEPILAIQTDDGYQIRDGHHRWVRAIMHNTPELHALVIQDPR